MTKIKWFLFSILLITPIIALASISAEFYISPPPLHFPRLHHAHIISKLIQCESGGRNIVHLDTNGLNSYGILQIQKRTWEQWSKESGIKGDPMNRHEAMIMADWAISKGLGPSWTCWDLLGFGS